ncbi:unnamed protein product [Echinostoma caproni]|uniref:Mediator of RNA polymerase II transcription subunit 7 n=1 Tax=Echinostoma caproni TaxID=27848 RepID=A0A183A0S6_9TREM|nr:unnamed protein product [Echinostoma caproni]
MLGADDEFVVPHMDIACLQNSLAYQKVLEEPWTYLHNWNTHAPSVQQELVQNFLSTLGQLKAELAVPQAVFDPYTVNMMNNQSSEVCDLPSPSSGFFRILCAIFFWIRALSLLPCNISHIQVQPVILFILDYTDESNIQVIPLFGYKSRELKGRST